MKVRPCAAGEKAWRLQSRQVRVWRLPPSSGLGLWSDACQYRCPQSLMWKETSHKGPGLGRKLLPPGLAPVQEIPKILLFSPLEKCTFEFPDAGNDAQKQTGGITTKITPTVIPCSEVERQALTLSCLVRRATLRS